MVEKRGCECMWKDSCEHDGMMAFVDAGDWWGPEGVAWVPCDG